MVKFKYLEMSCVRSMTGAGDGTPPPCRDDETLERPSSDVTERLRSLRLAGDSMPSPANSDARFYNECARAVEQA